MFKRSLVLGALLAGFTAPAFPALADTLPFYGVVQKPFTFSSPAAPDVRQWSETVPKGAVVQIFGDDGTAWNVLSPSDVGSSSGAVFDIPKANISPLPVMQYPDISGTVSRAVTSLSVSFNNLDLLGAGPNYRPEFSVSQGSGDGADAGPAYRPGDSVTITGREGGAYIINGKYFVPVDAVNVAASDLAKGKPVSIEAPNGATNWLLVGGGAIAALLALFGGGLWVRRYNKAHPPKALPGFEVIPAHAIAAGFPNFTVAEGELLKRGEKLFRVNSNGLRINLDKWSFDSNTGEWLKKSDGGRLLKTATYNQRYTEYYGGEHKAGRIGGPIVLLVFGGATIPCFANLFDANGFSSGMAVVFLFLTGIPALAGLYVTIRANNEAGEVGPEPFTRKTEDFGPGSATSAPDHPADDDLTY